MEKNHYEILGINNNATVEEIKKAYKKKVMEYHPDVNHNLNNEDMIREINVSYEKIMEEKKNTFDGTNNSVESANSLWNKYKRAGNNFDITALDPDCIFVGDVYVVKYKMVYDELAPFSEQTYMKLKEKDAILLRIGFERYINLSKIKSLSDAENIKRKLKDSTEKEKVTILGSFFKPYAGNYVALNVKAYSQLEELEKQKNKKTAKRLMKFMSYK